MNESKVVEPEPSTPMGAGIQKDEVSLLMAPRKRFPPEDEEDHDDDFKREGSAT